VAASDVSASSIRRQRDRIAEVLHTIHLKPTAPQRMAGLLSHGQKQWLEIGMLLMQDPKLLLLDEPVAGMTDEETERTAELFLSLARQALAGGGGARHEAFVDQHRRQEVTVLHEGSVLAEGTLDQVQADER
jgi:urea transport system ATP-binding protein